VEHPTGKSHPKDRSAVKKNPHSKKKVSGREKKTTGPTKGSKTIPTSGLKTTLWGRKIQGKENEKSQKTKKKRPTNPRRNVKHEGQLGRGNSIPKKTDIIRLTHPPKRQTTSIPGGVTVPG